MSARVIKGGDKLKLLLNTVRNAKGHAKVGWFAGNKYEGGISVAQVAIYNEYGYKDGTRYVPARPFMRTAFNQYNKEWSAIILRSLQNDGQNYNFYKALSFGAIQAVSDIQASILSSNWQPNAPSTIKRKGFDRPLIDTGIMLKLVSYSVVI